MSTVAPAPPARSAHDRPVAATAVLLVLALVAAVLAAVLVAPAAPASAAPPAFRDHPGLVPEQPARGYPVISDQPTIRQTNPNCPKGCDVPREVLATDQVGRFIVSGGNFLTVELQDGTVLDQPHFTAWNIDTKQIACPGLTFDNDVLKVLPGNEPTTVYVAGRFAKITDAAGVTRTRNRIAKIDLATCTVDKTFTSPTPSSKVDELALLGDRLFVGGDFNTIGGRAISTLAELDATTGAVRPAFALGFSGGLSSRLRGMALNPAGTRLLVAGRFGTITGNGVSVVNPTAMIDISAATPVLTRHSSTGYTDTGGRTMPIKRLQDASFSPDGSVVGLAYGTGTIYDFVYLTPMTEVAGTRYRWRHYMRDSSYGIGVSNNAVYVAGHFCKPDGGPGPSEVMAPVPGITTQCSGAQMKDGVWRSKLAALSLTDGTPLTWNPGSHSFRGGQVITVTSRGLLVGFDGSRTNNIRTGALAFFDLGAGAEDAAAPAAVAFASPSAGQTVGDPVTISGSATDDVGVRSFGVTLRHADGRYVQGDGRLAANRYERSLPASAAGDFSFVTSMPPGDYVAEAVAADAAGNTSPVSSLPFNRSAADVAPPASTLALPDAAREGESVTVTGRATDDVGVAKIQVRVRDDQGRFLQPGGDFAARARNLAHSTDEPLPATSVGWTLVLGSGLPEGRHTVWVRVVDAAGNAATRQRGLTVQPAR